MDTQAQNRNYMVIGSHNSWSYLPVKRWWMRPIAFMARCQSVDIRKQYELGVRCFDLRIRSDKDGALQVAHGCVVYDIGLFSLMGMLSWFDKRGDVMVRILHEVRNESQYTHNAKFLFADTCGYFVQQYPHIRFWCGRNLYDWQKDYNFGDDPSCEERYSSVCPPKLLVWWPWLWARLHNMDVREKGTESEILLMDFVDIK